MTEPDAPKMNLIYYGIFLGAVMAGSIVWLYLIGWDVSPLVLLCTGFISAFVQFSFYFSGAAGSLALAMSPLLAFMIFYESNVLRFLVLGMTASAFLGVAIPPQNCPVTQIVGN